MELARRGVVQTGRLRIRSVRLRLITALAILFVAVMILAGLVTSDAQGDGASVVAVARLAVIALVLPTLMARLVSAVMQPAEELQAAHDRLERLYDEARADALIDPITGLGNHRAFQEELTRQIEDARRQKHSLALALIDLDDLKRINDERGHVGGDEVLATMGRLMAATARAADRGFRIGGDEFAILLPRADTQAALAVVRRLLASTLASDPERRGAQSFSFSSGLSAYPDPAGDGRQLFREADSALYYAKRHGRTDVQVFDPERHGAADDERSGAELAEAVSRTATDRALSPLYQTVFDLQTGAAIGYEGLVRPTERADFRDAHQLFVAAEASGRTVELDRACAEVVVEHANLPDDDSFLAINISPRTLETEQFRVSELLQILAPQGIASNRLVLELTEREAIEDIDRLRENVLRCQAEGIRIAADDVGAGNAGLRLLSEVAFDIVKIDLSLVQRGVLRDSALAVLVAIRDIARNAGAMVVAEGVETANQLEVVRSLDLVAGQGYLLSLPATHVQTAPLDLSGLLATHAARRKALGGFLDLDLSQRPLLQD